MPGWIDSIDTQQGNSYCLRERDKTTEHIPFYGRACLQRRVLDRRHSAAVAQSVERVLGKDEVKGSSPLSSSRSAGGVMAVCVKRDGSLGGPNHEDSV